MENFNQTLKNYLAGQGLNQSEIGERLGISRTMVNNYLNGQRNFGKVSADRWSQEFGLDSVWLMSGGDKGTPPQGVAVIAQDSDIINVPILNLDVRGGLAFNDTSDALEYAVDTMPFSTKIAQSGDFVVPVFGDSMSPRYPAGSHILIRPLPLWREWLEMGCAYVLELTDWRRTIKIVRKGSDDMTYRLECYNVDYDTTEIKKSLIEHVFQVLAVVKRETM